MTFNSFLALGTIGLQVAGVLLLLPLVFPLRSHRSIIESVALPLVLAATLFATGVSLYHSEILGLVPCGLCWLQRIFIYPLVAIFLIAWLRRDYGVYVYGLALSIIGSVIALYHHLLQSGLESSLPCPAVAGAVECSKRVFFEFGYITYPMMSLSLFFFVIVLMFYVRGVGRRDST